ncbi:hypothetical protein EBL87_15335 [Cereibacter sphaeroides]|uniref:hypothetical protein n=1 Tax=Cereibacter sphaeroides TaxID=1063 RepID=UPI000F53BE8A|nr:hypothetical protein [Cereibacter sphaeroides]AZB65046.1 hypothetical protein EBL87_15335 [Cereibacter sphaeroides]AZB67070.1 hypothetical protein EBL86_01075 [Cereibacter sphaeroides]
MIVVRRIWEGTRSHFPIRATEWIMAVPLLGIGYALYLDDELFSRTPSFSTLAEYGDETSWCIVIMACAICRLLALLINGTFHGFTHSPLIRLAASLTAMSFWSLFTIGIATAYLTHQGAPTGIIAYGTFMVMELRNIYLSRQDMVLSKGR